MLSNLANIFGRPYIFNENNTNNRYLRAKIQMERVFLLNMYSKCVIIMLMVGDVGSLSVYLTSDGSVGLKAFQSISTI